MAAADTDLINRSSEKEIIAEKEENDMINTLFDSIDDEDINNYILITDASQIFEKLGVIKNDSDENEDKDEVKKEESKINEEFDFGGFHDVDMDSSSKSICTQEENTFWTLENILLSKELLSIVKSKKVLLELSQNISCIINKSKSTVRSVVSRMLKALRKLFIVCLYETCPKKLGKNIQSELISTFTGRKVNEVLSFIHIEDEIISSKSSDEPMEEVSFINYTGDHDKDIIFDQWLKSEAKWAKSTVPNELLSIMNKICQDGSLMNQNNILPDDIQQWINILDNSAYYDFLKGNYNEESLFSKMAGKTKRWKLCKKLISDIKLKLEDRIVKWFVVLSLRVKSIDVKKFGYVLSKWIGLNKFKATNIIKSRINKETYFVNFNQKELKFNFECNNALNKWKTNYLDTIKNYFLCGIWFWINLTNYTYINIDKSELYLLERLWKHEKKFKEEHWSGNWVKEKNQNILFKEEYSNSRIDFESKEKPIGFSIWKYCRTTFRNEERYERWKGDQNVSNLNRKEIGIVDFDFRQTPKEIRDVPVAYLDYIQMGILYLKPTLSNALRMMMITGDIGFRLSNGSLGTIKKIQLKKIPSNSGSKTKILEALEWLKENNHLTRTYITNYESNEISELIKELNINKDEPYTDDYYVVDEIDLDRKLHNYDIIEKLGRRYAISRDPFGILKENYAKKSEIKARSIIFYDDPYLEEKLFVHLFPYGTGGYNSTFCKIMDFSHYMKMRLLWGYSDRFRKDKEYIFFLYDWSRKKQIYSHNYAVPRLKISDLFENYISGENLLPVKNKSDYFKKFGRRVPQNMRYSYLYKKSRFYEIQTLLYNFGIPDLFITVRWDYKDEECKNYVSETFWLDEESKHSWVKNVVEYSSYFSKKIQFIRSHLKNKK